ncbi:MAG TPA: glycoside hydrolase family 127 protein, partial [Oscillospiraceae bacterium]|nr:glycoside hydrolase family 127 protein [Oscillospiraceae bacterium]
NKAMNASGGPTGVVEYLAPVGSVTETEYCSFTYYNAAYSAMSAITGESKYGDYAEQLVYNGAQGARKKDERAIAYLSAPNQVYATDISSNDSVDMQVYSPCYPVACCPANSVILMPEFIRGMALADENRALYLTAYGPCTIRHNGLTIEEKTLYPFKNSVTLDVTGNGVLYCKNPAWSKETAITVDGKTQSAEVNQNGFIRLDLIGSDHHNIELSFRAEIEVLHIDDSDNAGKHPLAFRYGALLFSLPIQEKWEPYYPQTETPLPEEWPWYKVKPVFEEASTDDNYLRLQLRRDRIYWNVAVDENLKAEDIKVEYNCKNGYVWSEPHVVIKIPAYKAPYSCCLYPSKTFEPFGDCQRVAHPIELTLVPYGCTNLRITYFPRADLEKKL